MKIQFEDHEGILNCPPSLHLSYGLEYCNIDKVFSFFIKDSKSKEIDIFTTMSEEQAFVLANFILSTIESHK